MSRLVLLCAAAFAALTVLVTVGAAPGDAAVSAAAVQAARTSPATTRAAQVVEAVTQPGWVYLAGSLGLLLAFRGGRRRQAVAALAAGAVAAVASPLLKALTDRARPALEAGLTSAGGGSFPSGHVLASATVVLCLVLLLAPPTRWGVVAVLGAVELVVVSVDRVWLGAHWPSDVLGGWLLAAVLVGTATVLSQRHGHRRGAALRPRREGHG
ncbi:phosphatase PAP2 family protein [Kineococcus rhizosphaerae]|uniref:Undecaprenyl-diphosphatase n=1 Tax=Kineococcus rhizosphaerae TaxID=559628 RepID=A0A2T0R9P5_9ACTN|nr:phosphatase PAP2 family protein [Kineococcus rhizosphaerae]PRY17888.1 undecaprenyl-diphosphatase [Kineococcus rhizosphaerae]